MRLVCPTCTATYDVAPDILPQSGQVRCARCGAEWRIERPAAPAPPKPEPGPPAEIRPAPVWPEVLASAPLPARRTPAEPFLAEPVATRNRNVIAAWALSLVVLATLTAAAFVFHDGVQSAWPPSARFFSLFGL